MLNHMINEEMDFIRSSQFLDMLESEDFVSNNYEKRASEKANKSGMLSIND
jgi:hypothetical protein